MKCENFRGELWLERHCLCCRSSIDGFLHTVETEENQSSGTREGGDKMKKPLKITLRVLGGIIALALVLVIAFVGIYFTRIQSMNSIERITD